MDKNSLLFKVYKELENLENCGFNTWIGRASELIENNNLDINLEIDKFKHHAKIRLNDKYKQEWLYELQDIPSNPTMRTYTHFKSDFGMEGYLSKVSNFKYRHAITQFRTMQLPFSQY